MSKYNNVSEFYIHQIDNNIEDTKIFNLGLHTFDDIYLLETAIVLFIWKFVMCEKITVAIDDSVAEIEINDQISCRDIYLVIKNVNKKIDNFSYDSMQFFKLSYNDEGLFIMTNLRKISYLNEVALVEILETVISQLNISMTKKVEDVIYVSDDKYHQIVELYNETEMDYHEDYLLHHMFEMQAKEHPNFIAVSDGDNELTYKQLDELSNKIAYKLVQLGVCSNEFIAISMTRSITMIASMIAILKVGCTYIPINQSTPIERVAMILKSSACDLMIVDENNWKKYDLIFNEKQVNCFVITNDAVLAGDNINYCSIMQLNELSYQCPVCKQSESDDLAYVIYTSGTTGIPKGVKVSHKSAVNVIEWMNETFDIKYGDKLLFVTSISFDLSVYDIFGILASGGTIRIAVDDELNNPFKLLQILCSENITIWDSAPPALQQVMLYVDEIGKTGFDFSKMKYFFLSGDWIPVQLPNKLRNYFVNSDVISLGGATEATIWSNYFFIDEVNDDWTSIPYGKPIQNAKYYILDKNYKPLPEYFEGEIFIGGECLALGYLGDDELTKKKFILNPFNINERIYATGDLGRWMYDGNIELLGRIDNQVKIRGYRIELDEIKTLINQLEYVEDTVVTVYGNDNSEKSMCAFVLLKQDFDFGQETILLDGWKNVFNHNYKEESEHEKNDFVGWNDSISGNQIEEQEMKEWLGDTLNIISSYRPRNVLEVGCGTGMIMSGLLSVIDTYDGSDISENALVYINSKLEYEQDVNKKIRLTCNAADDFSIYENRKYDTIILNSVIQYFPNYNYLENVIKKSIKHIKPEGGHIFIGDVINYDYNVEILNITNNMEEEKELFVSPTVFYFLQTQNPQIKHVEILFKNGIYQNELSKYRYDVILHINEEPDYFEIDDLQYVEWKEMKTSLLQKLDSAIVVNHVPLALLQGENRNDNKILDEILLLKDEFVVKCIYCPMENDCKILISKSDNSKILKVYKDGFFVETVDNFQISNNVTMPFFRFRKAEVEEKIRKYLSKYVPSYMIPSVIRVVESIPLTSNGKVDTKKLLRNNTTSVRSEEIEPSSEIEYKVLRIFQKVLGKNGFGVTDKFSELGGHSIKATIICLEIEKKFNVKVLVKDILECQTVRKISEMILSRDKKNYVPIEKKGLKETPASSNQRRMYVAQNLVRNNIAYNIVDINRIKGEFSAEKFVQALNNMLKDFSILRTSFCEIGGELWQKASDVVELDYEIFEINDSDLIQLLIKERNRAFDLEKAPLWKTIICNLSRNEHFIIFIFHHIIMDGISLGIFKKELSSYYACNPKTHEIIDFLDYTMWECEKMNGIDIVAQQKYWLRRLNEISKVTYVEPDYSRPTRKSYNGANKFFDFPQKIFFEMNRVSNKMNITPFTILIASYFILLYKYTGNEDIVIGSVAANRIHPDTVGLLGMLVNTIPLRMKIDAEKSVKEFLINVEENIRNDLENQSFPYEMILGECVGNNIEDIFSAVIAYQNINNLPLELEKSSSEHINFENSISKFDISFIFNEKRSGLELEVEYSTDLYSYNSIQKLVRRFYFLLENILNNISVEIKDLQLESKEVIAKIYNNLNNTAYQYNDRKTYIERFFEVCFKNDEKIALVEENRSVTYGRLCKMVCEISFFLKSLELPQNSVIAIFAKTSIETIAAQVAILNCGHAFICLDTNHPIERNKFIIEDSKVNLVLYCDEIPDVNYKVLFKNLMDVIGKKEKKGKYPINLKYQYCPRNTAYVIYTSGSSGQPKGVAISYQSLLNLCIWHNNYYHVTGYDAATRYAGPSFDAAVWELFPYLIVGATVHIIPEKIKLELDKLNSYFEEKNITITFLPTQLAEEFMKIKNGSLRCLLTGGDVLRNFCKTNYSVYNNYGPTENTVVTTVYPVEEKVNRIPIGTPIYNSQVYVLDKFYNLLPDNVLGELAISGDGLAVGYVNQELNNGKFIQLFNKRVYLTGDIVRLNGDGVIEFLHRKDEQVQIRGYRIELGEIEYNIGTHKEVESCIVIAKKIGDEYILICFYIAKKELDVNLLKEFLLKKLPSYMIPSYFILKKEFPLMTSGKVDRRKLAQTFSAQIERRKIKGSAIKSEEEKIIATIWCKLFSVKKIYAETNFYELGGDSIRAVQFISKLRTYGYSLEVSDVYENPVLKNLAKKMCKYNNNGKKEVKVSGKAELFSIQKWYLSKIKHMTEYFNMAEFVRFEGRIDEIILKQALDIVVEYHDALRSSFSYMNGKWNLDIGEKTQEYYTIEIFEIQDSREVEIFAQSVQRKLLLEARYTISVGVFHMERNDHILFSVKHLVIDAYSFTILLQDVFSVYESLLKEEVVNLPMKTASIVEWVEKVNDSINLTVCDYWKIQTQKIFSKKNNLLQKKYNCFEYQCFYEGELVDKLKKLSGKAEYNIETILICSFVRCFCEIYGKEEVVINIEKHGRDNSVINLDISRTIGWFTNKYPVELESMENVESNIYNINQRLRESKQFGLYYDVLGFTHGEKIIDYYEPQISFNYLGQYQDNEYASFVNYSDLPKGQIFSKKSQRFYDLDINAKIYNKKLYISYVFNKNVYLTKDITFISEVMNIQLDDIIEKCYNISDNKVELIKKEIEEVMPFSDVFYKDCYIQALIPIINLFEGDLRLLFANDMFYYEKINNSIFPIRVKNDSLVSIDEVLEEMNIGCYKIIRAENIIIDIKKALNHNHPVIINVDCFFSPIRMDTYQKIHLPHVLLVVGFDDMEEKFTVIEHDNLNSTNFRKQKISYLDLEKAYKGGIEYFDDGGIITYYEFYQRKKKKSDSVNYSEIFIRNYNKNVKYILEGIGEIKAYLERDVLFELKRNEMQSDIENVILLINNIINYKKTACYAVKMLLDNEREIHNMYEKIVGNWEAIRKFFFGIKYLEVDDEIDFLEFKNCLLTIIELEKEIIFSMCDLLDE